MTLIFIMKFSCEDCSYETTSRTDFHRHENTDKHLKLSLNKIQDGTAKNQKEAKKLDKQSGLKELSVQLINENKELVIEKYAAVDLIRKQKDQEIKKLKTQHQQEIKKVNTLSENKIQQDQQEFKKYKTQTDKQILQLQQENKQQRDEINKLHAKLYEEYEEKVIENKELKQVKANQPAEILENMSGIQVSQSKDRIKISAFNYARKHFKTTGPAIKNFEESNLLGEDDIAIGENAVYYHKKKQFHMYIGDILIKVYKKDDPKTQSLWSSDINRIVYIFRIKLDESTDWIKDNKGMEISARIIVPALKYVQVALEKYREDLATKMSLDDPSESLNGQQMCAELIGEIVNNNTYKTQILKYIAPSFKLNIENFYGKSIAAPENTEVEEIEEADEADEVEQIEG